uniref:Uncharacterized protein n=1 Tax=Meloidogyne floridensis TaxID=298350 RepID=A0A915PGI1_9BILA
MFPTKNNNNNLFLNNLQSTTTTSSSSSFYNLPSTSNQFSNLTNNINQIPQQNLNYSFCIYPYFNYNNYYNYYSSNNLHQQHQQLNNNNLLFNNQSSKINYNSLAIKNEINPASSFINQAIRNELAKRCGLRADQKKKKKDKEFLENQQKQNSNLKTELNNENKELSFPPTTYCFNNYYSNLNEEEQLPFLN